MESSIIFEYLKNPEFYDSDVESVEVLQTHISFVALTGAYAYKVKKPVDFGFLDFSTLEKRKYYCEEELRLNRRLCPEIYLDVVSITRDGKELRLGGPGEVVEYAVKMKEFPQKNIMTNLLQKGKIREDIIDEICGILVDFYRRSDRSSEIDVFGSLSLVKKNIDENFEQTTAVIDRTISKKIYDEIMRMTALFFQQKKHVFEQRVHQGHIGDCHGDLHSGNIVIGEKVCIFDCIEFNKRFRYCDVASDIGFLAMDLDYLNFPYLSSFLIERYIERSKDADVLEVLNFYKSYRAYVRGKVIGFQLNDPHIDERKKNEIIEIARSYFELSHYYASLVTFDLERKQPVLFLVNGLTGTGKSTVALKIAVDYHASVINTDVVRKEMAGLDKFERHLDQPDTGLYEPEKITLTYQQVLEKAAALLRQGRNVVVDATFQKQQYREMVEQVVEDTKAVDIWVRCTCPDQVVKQRLEERLKKKSVSDGRWEIYLHQKQTFEPFLDTQRYLEFDTSNESPEYRMMFYNKLLSVASEAR